MTDKGRFIVFEGPDGVGKTSLSLPTNKFGGFPFLLDRQSGFAYRVQGALIDPTQRNIKNQWTA